MPSGAAKSATEVRQGVMLGKMRWVLGASLLLLVVALLLAYAPT